MKQHLHSTRPPGSHTKRTHEPTIKMENKSVYASLLILPGPIITMHDDLMIIIIYVGWWYLAPLCSISKSPFNLCNFKFI